MEQRNPMVLSDSDIIENIIKNSKNGMAVIPPRQCDIEPERTHWLIDRAILIPENTTVILENCKIKLSDKARDNFFRSANCTGVVGEELRTIQNIHIIGRGAAVLEGADHPRSTGDETKTLKCPCYKTDEDLIQYSDWISEEERNSGNIAFWTKHDNSYGTDSGKDGELQQGDWRNIGILFVCVEKFSIENITVVESHGWGISLENCAFGNLKNITFDAKMQREIDGILHNIENQDGIDLRNGCHDICLTDIYGQTGDDLIALTAIAGENPYVHRNGELNSTHYMHNDWSRRDPDIHNVIIRNVIGRSQGGAICGCCAMIRFLPAQTKIYNVVVDGVINVHEDGLKESYTLLMGDRGDYGKNLPDSMSGFTVSNVICNSKNSISVLGYLSDSVITNVVNQNPNCEPFSAYREDGLRNVVISNAVTVG